MTNDNKQNKKDSKLYRIDMDKLENLKFDKSFNSPDKAEYITGTNEDEKKQLQNFSINDKGDKVAMLWLQESGHIKIQVISLELEGSGFKTTEKESFEVDDETVSDKHLNLFQMKFLSEDSHLLVHYAYSNENFGVVRNIEQKKTVLKFHVPSMNLQEQGVQPKYTEVQNLQVVPSTIDDVLFQIQMVTFDDLQPFGDVRVDKYDHPHTRDLKSVSDDYERLAMLVRSGFERLVNLHKKATLESWGNQLTEQTIKNLLKQSIEKKDNERVNWVKQWVEKMEKKWQTELVEKRLQEEKKKWQTENSGQELDEEKENKLKQKLQEDSKQIWEKTKKGVLNQKWGEHKLEMLTEIFMQWYEVRISLERQLKTMSPQEEKNWDWSRDYQHQINKNNQDMNEGLKELDKFAYLFCKLLDLVVQDCDSSVPESIRYLLSGNNGDPNDENSPPENKIETITDLMNDIVNSAHNWVRLFFGLHAFKFNILYCKQRLLPVFDTCVKIFENCIAYMDFIRFTSAPLSRNKLLHFNTLKQELKGVCSRLTFFPTKYNNWEEDEDGKKTWKELLEEEKARLIRNNIRNNISWLPIRLQSIETEKLECQTQPQKTNSSTYQFQGTRLYGSLRSFE